MKTLMRMLLGSLPFLTSGAVSAQQFTGCLGPLTGALYNVQQGDTPLRPCFTGHQTVRWSIEGPEGPRGDPGPPGQPGRDGLDSDFAGLGNIVGELHCQGLGAEGLLANVPGQSFVSYTDDQGFFRFLYVPEGVYDITIHTESQGNLLIPDVDVFSNQTTAVGPIETCEIAPPPPPPIGQDQCLINGTIISAGEGGLCLACNPAVSQTQLTPRSFGTPCGTNRICNGQGACINP